jgi:DNA-binding transcriptional MerR regulator
VSPNTLRVWERRFGYPKPRRSAGKQRVYTYAEITALRDALAEGLSISSAVSVARDTHGADAYALLRALCSFRGGEADRAMEASLALRSVARSIEEVLLPAVETIRRRQGERSAAFAFAGAWSEDWLHRARRLVPALAPRGRALIGDASAPPLDPARTYLLALEVCCARSGIEVLTLPIRAAGRLREAVAAVEPDAVVIAGSDALNDEVARWAYQVRMVADEIPFLLYQREIGSSTPYARARALSNSPVAAHSELLELIERRAAEKGPDRTLVSAG